MSKGSGMAITTLVLGILSFCLCGVCTGIPAIICGHIALGRIRRGEEEGQPLAMVGLVLGYMCLVFTLIIVAIYIVLFLLGMSIPLIFQN